MGRENKGNFFFLRKIRDEIGGASHFFFHFSLFFSFFFLIHKFGMSHVAILCVPLVSVRDGLHLFEVAWCGFD